MKKIVILTILTVLALSVAACDNGGNTAGVDTSSPPPTPAGLETSPTEAAASNKDAPNPLESILTNSENNEQADTGTGESKILIAYFSRVGNTNFDTNVDAVSSATLNSKDGELVGNNQIIADMLVELTGGNLFAIRTVDTYPSSYRETTDVAAKEQSDNARPALSTHIENMDDYDTIILCYPNWWGTIPMALFTFLEEYDFSGKTIAPICTHEGSGLGSSESDIKKLVPDAEMLDGLAIRGGRVNDARENVEDWLTKLELIMQGAAS